jgi:hypothetical protein
LANTVFCAGAGVPNHNASMAMANLVFNLKNAPISEKIGAFVEIS